MGIEWVSCCRLPACWRTLNFGSQRSSVRNARLPLEQGLIDHQHGLGGLELVPGRSAVATQAILTRLALALFDARKTVAGRGQARKAVRRLLVGWEDTLMEQPATGQVGRILRAAPFLWEDGYRHHRSALVGVHQHAQADPAEIETDPVHTAEQVGSRAGYCWVVGSAAFRDRVLARTREPEALIELVTGRSARSLWRGRPLETESKAAWSPADLVEQGRWGAALARWRKEPPLTPLEELAMADCLFSLGQFSEAHQMVRDHRVRARKSRSKPNLRWTLLLVRNASQLGQLKVASRALKDLLKREADWSRLSILDRYDLYDSAIRLCANQRNWDEVKGWARRALRWRGTGQAYGRILAAGASWDLNDLDGVMRHLQVAIEIEPEIVDDWRYQWSLGLLFLVQERSAAAVAAFESALSMSRRSLRVFDAGRLWTELVVARTLDQDLAGAERACRHAIRLLRQCDGPSRTTLTQFNYAELRTRRGRFDGVEEIVHRSIAENALAGNQRGGAMDVALLSRLLMARGELDASERRLRECLDMLGDVDRGGNVRAEVELLLARCLAWLGRSSAAFKALLRASATAERDQERGGNQDGDSARDSEVVFERLPKGILEPEELPALLLQAGAIDAARKATRGLCSESFWNRLINAKASPVAVSMEDWRTATVGLESYRAGRLIIDALLCGAQVDDEVLRMVSDELKDAGALGLADRVAGHLDGSWRAVAQFLETQTHSDELEASLRTLFSSAGVTGVRIEVDDQREVRTLVVGPGGEDCVEQSEGGLRFRFFAPTFDARARAMALLVARVLSSSPGSGLDASRHGRPGTSSERSLPEGVIGECDQLLKVYSDLNRLASSEMPLLILGETGTGKESAARSVHDASPRARGPFLPVNCAALDQHLALSDLFGHVKGAFTGADKDRQGVFEAAATGTVFLDEIGDLSMGAQGLLLRVLQEKEVRRVGESTPRTVDVRIVTATLRDLEGQVRDGTFREDLLYRLNTGVVTMPALRERGHDILLLAEHFRREFGPELKFSDGAQAALVRFAWPGNIRQLQNFVQRGCALAPGPVIGAEHLALEDVVPLAGWHEWLEDIKRDRLVSELKRHDGNQSATARSLGLTRQALSYLVRQLGLT